MSNGSEKNRAILKTCLSAGWEEVFCRGHVTFFLRRGELVTASADFNAVIPACNPCLAAQACVAFFDRWSLAKEVAEQARQAGHPRVMF